MYTYVGLEGTPYKYTIKRWEGDCSSSHDQFTITQPDSSGTRMQIVDIFEDIMVIFDYYGEGRLRGVRSPNEIIWTVDYRNQGYVRAYINNFKKSVIVLRQVSNSNVNIIEERDLETGELIHTVPYPSDAGQLDSLTCKRWGSYIIGGFESAKDETKYYYWSYNMRTRIFVCKHEDSSTIKYSGQTWPLTICTNVTGPTIYNTDQWLYVYFNATVSTNTYKLLLARINLNTWQYDRIEDASAGRTHGDIHDVLFVVGQGENYMLFRGGTDTKKWWKRTFNNVSLVDETLLWQPDESNGFVPTLAIYDIHRNPTEDEHLWIECDYIEPRVGNSSINHRWIQELTKTFISIGEPLYGSDELDNLGNPFRMYGVFKSSYLFEGELIGGRYNEDIIVPDEYQDTTNLNVYIECRKIKEFTTSTLKNSFDIRIVNPVAGGTPWYNFKGSILPANWRVRYQTLDGTIVNTGTGIINIKNEGWAISGTVEISIDCSYLNSSNIATIILEIQTPNGEWISSNKFQINNYSNEYNYKWRFNGEDDQYINFILNGDHSLSTGWHKPYTIHVYDGEVRTGTISASYGIVDNVATIKISKSSNAISNKPKIGYWFHFMGSGYDLSSSPRGYSGVEKCNFTIPLTILGYYVNQVMYEVTQQNNNLYIIGAYLTENIEVYKDGVKLNGSYNKKTGEIKFTLPEDTPKELKGYTLNLQYKVFYEDQGEIKSFMQDFKYTTYAFHFVEFDPDFEDYYWEKLESQPPTPNANPVNRGVMTSYNGYLYLVASYYNGGYTSPLYRYDIETGEWIELASAMHDVYRTQPIAYNNKIYVIGGVEYSSYKSINKVQIYNIETDTWSLGTDCPRKGGPTRYQPVLHNGKIYCYSGYCDEYPSVPNEMDIYDIETDTWETIETPYALEQYSATCIDGKIYIVDGRDYDWNYDVKLYIYDIETNTWIIGPEKPTYPNGGQGTGGTMLNKFVSVLGYQNSSINNMSFVYDIEKNKWMRLPDAPTPLYQTYEYPMCASDNFEFYVMKYGNFYRLTKQKPSYTDSYLYEKEGIYYTENDEGKLVQTTTQKLNADLFLNEGAYSINSELIENGMKVLYFKVENKDVVPQITYSGVYGGTTITMDWDLQSEQGKTFDVLGDVYSDDNVRFLLSNNKGLSWNTFDGFKVVSCDINDISTNGMTYDIFKSLNKSQLESFKGDTKTLRIAIYIERYSVSGKTNLDHIRLRY